jgi:hypothetical protein
MVAVMDVAAETAEHISEMKRASFPRLWRAKRNLFCIR